MFKRILAATDSSEASWDAVRAAIRMAADSKAELAVAHVVPGRLESPLTSRRGAEFDASPLLELEQRVRTQLSARIEELAGGQDVTLFIEAGEPYAEIIRRAEAFNADLVVLGSHGHSALERALLGSVAERVVRYAHGPVLVHRKCRGQGTVIAATDLSDPSLPAVRVGASQARERGAQLVLLHVVDVSMEAYAAAAGGLLGAIGALPPAGLQEERRQALTETLKTALERENVPGEVLVLEGSPALTIVRAAEEANAELVVVGTHGRTGLARIALGSVAERVIGGAPCPVLAVRLAPHTG